MIFIFFSLNRLNLGRVGAQIPPNLFNEDAELLDKIELWSDDGKRAFGVAIQDFDENNKLWANVQGESIGVHLHRYSVTLETIEGAKYKENCARIDNHTHTVDSDCSAPLGMFDLSFDKSHAPLFGSLPNFLHAQVEHNVTGLAEPNESMFFCFCFDLFHCAKKVI